ncbi:hypothetical protein FQN57_006468 [Myotisia sp. PD_48]|nr:hypothetical protein FQN57_006468 [Myotisia sp. PD_48]
MDRAQSLHLSPLQSAPSVSVWKSRAASLKPPQAPNLRELTQSTSRRLEHITPYETPTKRGLPGARHEDANQSYDASRPGRYYDPTKADDVQVMERPKYRRRSSVLSQTFVAESQMDHANISGTTFHHTYLEQDPPELDPDLILDALPDLLSSSTRVLDLLAPKGISYSDILQISSTLSLQARLSRLRNTFDAQKKCFGNKPFLSANDVTKVLPRISSVGWKPHAVISKANLAMLALAIIRPSPNIEIDSIEDHFPASFSTGSAKPPPPQSKDERWLETARLGLEMRTQRFIIQLKAHGNRSVAPSELGHMISSIFYNDPTRSISGLRGLGMDGVEDDGKLSRLLLQEIMHRVDSLMQSSLDAEAAEAAFPWSKFVVQAAAWIRTETNEIDRQLKLQIPLEKAIELLQVELDGELNLRKPKDIEPRDIEPKDIELQSSSFETPQSSAKPATSSANGERAEEEEQTRTDTACKPDKRVSFCSKNLVAHLMESLSRAIRSETPVDPVCPSSSGSLYTSTRASLSEQGSIYSKGRSLSSDRGVSVIGIDDEVVLSPPRFATPNATQAKSRRTEQSDSEEESDNLQTDIPASYLLQLAKIGHTTLEPSSPTIPRAAFIDRQPNAHRVSPISLDQRSPTPGPSTKSPRKKRNAAEAFSDDGRNDGDSGPIPKRSLRTQPTRMGQRILERDQHNEDERQPPSTRGRTQESATSQQSTNPETRQQRTTATPRKIRKRWSDQEEKRLVELIGDLGPKWAAIQDADRASGRPMLTSRSQGNLKDKARQMAFALRM